MRTLIAFITSGLLAVNLLQPVSAQQAKYTFPQVDDLPITSGLQDPFLKPDGTRVQTREEWSEQREYLKAMLIQYQYGTIPPRPEKMTVENVSSGEILNGTGMLDLFNITLSRNGHSVTLHCSLYRPNRPGRFPVIIKNDREVTQSDDVISKAIEMGYCISKYAREDLARDNGQYVRTGGAYDLYPEYTWGAIGVWAWGYQLVINALEQMDFIDLEKIVTTGHSRGGKTALAGAIFDERVALAGPNSSGLGGTASARIFELGQRQQTIDYQSETFPHWWGPGWYEFANREAVMPFDAHFNKLILAPRGLHNAHATEDYWANPLGTELTHRAAKKVYEWLGAEKNIGLHWRPGGHAQTYEDWVALLDFADLYFFGKNNGNEFDHQAYPDEPLPIAWDTPSSKDHGYNFPTVDELPVIEFLPDPFVMEDGSRVKTPADWEKQRDYLKAMVQHYMYGFRPPAPEDVDVHISGTGSTRSIQFTVNAPSGKSFSFDAGMFIPPGDGPFPVVIRNNRSPEPSQTEMAAERGYIMISYNRGQLDEDQIVSRSKSNNRFPAQAAYPDYSWETIMCWSWGYSVIIDWLETQDYVNMEGIVVTGHSRGGKAALIGGIMDERIALAVPSGSGAGGSGNWRFGDFGGSYREEGIAESLSKITNTFPYWFAPELNTFSGQEKRLPFDLHTVKALMAPRGLLSTDGTEDWWANPKNSQRTTEAAQEVYKFLGVPERIGHHFRAGGHAQNEEDWEALFDFADFIIKGKPLPSGFFDTNYPFDKTQWKWVAPAPISVEAARKGNPAAVPIE